MQTLTLEFESAADMEEAIRHLWERLAVTGEILCKPLDEGHWRLQVVSEKPVRSATLEKVKGRRVDD